jgi:hypothetical protein
VGSDQRDRFPGYDVLAQAQHWDEKTRELVLARVNNVPDICFFTDAEVAVLQPFVDVVMAQETEPKIPVLNFVDEKLASAQGDGYRYAELPEDEEVWRNLARELIDVGFDGLSPEAQRACVQERTDSRAWEVVHRDILQSYYSHPYAWNEIGFGGPAYPRGYTRFGSPHLANSDRETWEPREAFNHNPGRMREGLE